MRVVDIIRLPRRSQPRGSLCAWLRAMARACGRRPADAPAALSAARGIAAEPPSSVPTQNALLFFPTSGAAPLVPLAAALRTRFAGQQRENDALRFTISRDPQPRLVIDRIAYVEPARHGRAYRLAVEASSDTILSLETPEIDIIIDFVTRYVGEKLEAENSVKVAS